MIRTEVKSSQIHSVGYDPDTQTLEIQFLSGRGEQRGPGAVYQYRPFFSEQYAAFVGAPSIGAHFGGVIKANTALSITKTHGPDGIELPVPAAIQRGVA